MRFVEKMRIGEILDWKIFNRLAILPLLEMITRSGAGGFFRLILACCKSLGMPSRTLSRFKLVCPSRTASARARWRNKCSLSSREVKSIGAKGGDDEGTSQNVGAALAPRCCAGSGH